MIVERLHFLQSRAAQRLCAALFLLALLLPMAGQALRFTDADILVRERRRPAAFPHEPFRHLGDVLAFPRQFEAWLDDRFGFRHQLVLADSVIRAELFGQSTSDQVLLGRQGWFYLRQIFTTDETRKLDAFVDGGGVDRWIDAMERRRAWLAARSIDSLVVVAPDKERVYPEYLPGWARRFPVKSPIAALVRRVAERGSGLDILDLTRSVLDQKPRFQLYFKGDTHWNLTGAFHGGYLPLMARIGGRVPGAAALTSADVVDRPDRVSGRDLDLIRLLGISSVYNEDGMTTTIAGPTRVTDYSEDAGLPLVARVFTADLPVDTSLMVFHDSFTFNLMPFLSESFGRFIAVDSMGMHFNHAVVEKYQPKLVVFELVERNLTLPVPPED